MPQVDMRRLGGKRLLGLAKQVIDDAAAAEASAETVHGGERLLRGFGDVGGLRRGEAEVAHAAGLHAGLAEVAAHGGRRGSRHRRAWRRTGAACASARI